MCHAHTHIYIRLTTGLVQIWLPTRHWENNCSLKENTAIFGVFCLKSVTLKHFGYRVVQLWALTEVERNKESLRPGFTKQGDGSRQDSKEDSGRWSSSPGRRPGEWSNGIPGVSRHNSREFPTGYSWFTNSPEGGRGGPGGLVLHQTRAASGPRGLVLHQGGWDRSDPRGGCWIPGNSRLYSSV